MSIINGVPVATRGDAADEASDRRRPGRPQNANPHLIGLLRGTAPPAPEPASLRPLPASLGRPASLLWVIAFCLAVWGAAVALFLRL